MIERFNNVAKINPVFPDVLVVLFVVATFVAIVENLPKDESVAIDSPEVAPTPLTPPTPLGEDFVEDGFTVAVVGAEIKRALVDGGHTGVRETRSFHLATYLRIRNTGTGQVIQFRGNREDIVLHDDAGNSIYKPDYGISLVVGSLAAGSEILAGYEAEHLEPHESADQEAHGENARAVLDGGGALVVCGSQKKVDRFNHVAHLNRGKKFRQLHGLKCTKKLVLAYFTRNSHNNA